MLWVLLLIVFLVAIGVVFFELCQHYVRRQYTSLLLAGKRQVQALTKELDKYKSNGYEAIAHVARAHMEFKAFVKERAPALLMEYEAWRKEQSALAEKERENKS